MRQLAAKAAPSGALIVATAEIGRRIPALYLAAGRFGTRPGLQP